MRTDYRKVARELSEARDADQAKVMHALLLQGYSLRAVGVTFELSGERVRQLVKKYFPKYQAKRGRHAKA